MKLIINSNGEFYADYRVSMDQIDSNRDENLE